ncbi:MAG TPA: hypothetical protein VH763_16385 [Gemmatimonadales bacterium]
MRARRHRWCPDLPYRAVLKTARATVLPLLGFCTAATAQSPAPSATFRFNPDAGSALKLLWQASLRAHEERAACLGASVSHDTVYVRRILPLPPEAADSMGISATASIDRCGPPEWSGTVHTHVAAYDGDRPFPKFSGQDRVAQRMWYDRWHTDAVFCVVYSEQDAHCEADGVVGGIRRSQPYSVP